MSRDGGDAGYRPRVRSAYYERVYVHSPEGHLTDRQLDEAAQGPAALIAPCSRAIFRACVTFIP
jgi:hypothetical protein